MKNEKDVVIVKVTLKYLSALRKEVGRHIDPETAEVLWDIGQIMDPSGDEGPNLPKELQQGGDNYFVRSPGSDLWICFTDLPEATVKYLPFDFCDRSPVDLRRGRIGVRREHVRRPEAQHGFNVDTIRLQRRAHGVVTYPIRFPEHSR